MKIEVLIDSLCVGRPAQKPDEVRVAGVRRDRYPQGKHTLKKQEWKRLAIQPSIVRSWLDAGLCRFLPETEREKGDLDAITGAAQPESAQPAAQPAAESGPTNNDTPTES